MTMGHYGSVSNSYLVANYFHFIEFHYLMLQEYLGFLKQVYMILIFVNEFQADVFKAIGILTIF